MTDLLAIAADTLSLIGSALAITLEIRRARRRAENGQDDNGGSRAA
ncbi:hypothetical protein ACFWAR_00255 [Streptomyces sp. NPDC059917]